MTELRLKSSHNWEKSLNTKQSTYTGTMEIVPVYVNEQGAAVFESSHSFSSFVKRRFFKSYRTILPG